MLIRELLTRWKFNVNQNPLNKLDSKIGSIGGSFGKMAAAGTAALAAITIPALQLDKALSHTMTLTGKVGDEYDKLDKKLKSQAISRGVEFGFSAEEVGGPSFYSTISSGVEEGTEAFTNLNKAGLKLAQTGGTAPAVAIESLADTLNAFKMDVSEYDRIANTMFASTIKGSTTLTQLAEAYTKAGPAAAAANMSIEETSGLLIKLSAISKGADAGTAVRQILNRITKTNSIAGRELAKYVKVYEKGGKKLRPIVDVLYDLQQATKKMTSEKRKNTLSLIAGDEAETKLTFLLGTNLMALKELNAELLTHSDRLDKAFGEKTRTASFQLLRLKLNIAGILKLLGGPIVESLGGFVRGINDLLSGVRKFLDEHPDFTKALGRILIIFTGVTAAVSGLLAFLPGLGKKGTIFTKLAKGASKWLIGILAVTLALDDLYITLKDPINNKSWIIELDRLMDKYKSWLKIVSPVIAAMRELVDLVKEPLTDIVLKKAEMDIGATTVTHGGNGMSMPSAPQNFSEPMSGSMASFPPMEVSEFIEVTVKDTTEDIKKVVENAVKGYTDEKRRKAYYTLKTIR